MAPSWPTGDGPIYVSETTLHESRQWLFRFICGSDGLRLQLASSFKTPTMTVCRPRPHQQGQGAPLALSTISSIMVIHDNAISLCPRSLLKQYLQLLDPRQSPGLCYHRPSSLQAFPLRAKIILRHA